CTAAGCACRASPACRRPSPFPFPPPAAPDFAPAPSVADLVARGDRLVQARLRDPDRPREGRLALKIVGPQAAGSIVVADALARPRLAARLLAVLRVLQRLLGGLDLRVCGL